MIPIAEDRKGLLLELEKLHPLIAKQRKDQIKQARMQKEMNENVNVADSHQADIRKSNANLG